MSQKTESALENAENEKSVIDQTVDRGKEFYEETDLPLEMGAKYGVAAYAVTFVLTAVYFEVAFSFFSFGSFGISLFGLVPLMVLTGAGYFTAKKHGFDDTKNNVLTGMLVSIGYIPASILGSILLGALMAGPFMGAAVGFTAGGIITPPIFGAVGGYVDYDLSKSDRNREEIEKYFGIATAVVFLLSLALALAS
ncbi:MAG: hypothetical protein ABEK59_10595 [Halobacteria archaeon]